MDRLQALEVFMLVAKLGSFTAASRAANLTASRVTHLIQNLEKELGVSLFSRTTRRVSLSSAGQALFEQLDPNLGFITETLQNIKELSNEEPKGTIRISAPVKFGSTFLMKPITVFLKKYPDVRIVLNTTNDPQEIFKGGADIAFVLVTEMPLSGVRVQQRNLCKFECHDGTLFFNFARAIEECRINSSRRECFVLESNRFGGTKIQGVGKEVVFQN